MFGILYGVITGLGIWMGAGSAWTYLILAFVFLGIQYLILHRMVAELAKEARLPKPKVGISQLSIPDAFAFGRTQRDGRVCVTQGILNLLNKEELKRVEGVRAFFLNDPARSWREVRELSQIDRDMSGTIDYDELMELRQKEVRLGTGDKLMELFTTHPNMLKRIKHLSTLTV